jgi:TPR repeat protein
VRAKELGYTKALTNLGIFYNRGIYVQKDAMIAKDLFQKAADKGDIDALFYVAYFKLKEASLSEND